MGVWVWLASELMFFAALFAAYFMIRQTTSDLATAGQQTLWQTESGHLAVGAAAINTLILVLSSVTCQMGVHAAEHGQVKRTKGLGAITSWGMREWYTLTFIMGAVFIAGQVAEYITLIGEGHTISSSVYFSAFFLATGFHGLHVTGGLVLFLFTLARTWPVSARLPSTSRWAPAACRWLVPRLRPLPRARSSPIRKSLRSAPTSPL